MNIDSKVQEILTNNGLDFTIEKLPLVGQRNTTSINEGGELVDSKTYVKSPYFGLLNSKTNEIINTVKAGYTISQNEDVVRLILEGIAPFGDKISVQNAGSLNGGRRVFMQLLIEGDSKVGNDTIKRYVTVIDSNDGSTGLAVGIGDLTMSCSNQFFSFYKGSQSKMRHSVSLVQRIQEIPSLVELALEQSMEMVRVYQGFQSTPVSRDLAHKMVNHILGIDKTMSVKELADMSTKATNAMDALYRNIETEMNSKGNNVWGLHSGVTRWTTHDKSAPRRDNGRIESLMVGTNYRTNQASLEFAQSLV